MLGKKTFLMVRGENNNPGFIDEIKSLIRKDYESGIIKIRDILLNIFRFCFLSCIRLKQYYKK